MWKLIVGFIAFAALALFVLTKSGGDIDLTGEKHDVTAGGHEQPAASAPAASEVAAATTEAAASEAASAASAQ